MINEVNEAQLELFDYQVSKADTSMTFADNMKLPIHRWFRYSAGFSGAWVKELIKSENGKRIIDPFAGSGTVMLESEFEGVESFGLEPHPFVNRIGNAKLNWKTNVEEFKGYAREVLEKAKHLKINRTEYPTLIEKCYPKEAIDKLEALKLAYLKSDLSDEYDSLIWFLITSILRKTSPVGTAQWQYVLPNKSKGNVIDPFYAYEAKLHEMATDMRSMQNQYPNASNGRILNEDARDIKSIPDGWGDLVITSPPYANNYDYADATRLELTFWGEIEGWGDLQEKIRKHLMVSCTQHVSKIGLRGNEASLLDSEELESIQKELYEVFNSLEQIRESKGGKKNYHLMILAYFHDLALVFKELRRVTQKGCKVCFIIGDSAPYGVYVPVDRWLGDLALAAGFNSYSFEKLRDRNTKWKNRKHTVPLQEGRLWING